MKLALLSAVMLAAPALADPQNKEIITWVTPYDGGNAHADTVRLINKAKKRIRVSAYAFTDTLIARALSQAVSRKVDVKVILDKSQAQNKYEAPVLDELKQGAVQYKIGTSPVDSQLLHMKMITVDGTYTMTGSYNFSLSAANQFNELDIIKSKKRAQLFEFYWDKVWDSIK